MQDEVTRWNHKDYKYKMKMQLLRVYIKLLCLVHCTETLLRTPFYYSTQRKAYLKISSKLNKKDVKYSARDIVVKLMK